MSISTCELIGEKMHGDVFVSKGIVITSKRDGVDSIVISLRFNVCTVYISFCMTSRSIPVNLCKFFGIIFQHPFLSPIQRNYLFSPPEAALVWTVSNSYHNLNLELTTYL